MRSLAEKAKRIRQKRNLTARRRLARIYWVMTHQKEVNEWYVEGRRRQLLRWRLKNHVRRARLRSDGNSKRVRIEVVDRLKRLQGGKCAVCKTNIMDDFRIDHVLPLALGGSNDPRNLQLLCKDCNSKKWHKHPVDFMQSIGYLL